MASSVFVESCTKHLKGGIGSGNEVPVSDSPDSNLVVVYGKKGVNFDHGGIENLIEKKTLSSISVIRLTSPTPSMIEGEEEEAEKSKEFLRTQTGCLSDVESNRSSDEISSSGDEVEDNTGSEIQTADDEKSDADCEISADNGKLDTRKKKEKNRRKMHSKGKIQNIQNKLCKERPDIVGLTVEEFYPPVSAKEVVKEALKLAGVSTFKRTADYEFQLYVIKNDHCYTPYTSPAQMKEKLTEKYKVEKHAAIGRKIIPHTAITMKQLQSKKKVCQGSKDFVDQVNLPAKDQGVKLNKILTTCPKQDNFDGNTEDDAGTLSSETESDIDILSEESGNTDNDRDSDLDFNVTNRKGRKKKDLVIKAKRLSAGKVYIKRPLQSHDEGNDQRNNIRTVPSNISNRSNKILSPAKIAGCAPLGVQKLLSDAIAALPPIPKRCTTAQIDEKTINSVGQPIQNAIRRGPIIEVSGQKTSAHSQLQGSPQSVKEIVINKVMASPKGGFTEIGELLSQKEKQTPTKADPSTPTSSTKSIVAVSSSKGFMPLGVETAVKNKLPAQISIQTHQSSSELAAKSKVSMDVQSFVQADAVQVNISTISSTPKEKMSPELAAEQFDLIVSIVKDEMQKTAMMEASKSKKSIPKFVNMLENVEHNLDSNATQSKMANNRTNFGSAETTVDDIDISNAPLLETPEGDEIPDDLLQHVVDLIEDDKTLQEAVEKQVFGGDRGEGIACVGSSDPINIIMPSTMARSIAPHTMQAHIPESDSGQHKSIIEMAISNLPSTPPVASSTVSNISNTVANVQTPKTTLAPTIRKEPIQIVRGNGRVITLPPIEAPTTRAKRRAQNQPVSAANLSTIFNESSMDSSIQSNTTLSIPDHLPPITVEKKNESKRRVSKETVAVSAAAGKGRKSVASAKKSAAAKANVSKSGPDADVSGSHDDDDDPNRLWCICRQPHNNRFMICCDVCEDWFHGTCVSITKAMGIEMEQKGIEWTCPKCVKLLEEKKQRKITDMLVQKKPASNFTNVKHDQLELEATSLEIVAPITPSIEENFHQLEKKFASEAKKSDQVMITKPSLKKTMGALKAVTPSLKKKLQASNSKQKMLNPPISQNKRIIPVLQQNVKNKMDAARSSVEIQTTKSPQQMLKDTQKVAPSESTQNDEKTFCIVCKKIARRNSIYCSDDCIRKHAQNALNMFAAASVAKSPELTTVSSTNEEINAKKKKQKGLFEDILSMADRKPKIERIHVIERKSGRVLTGSNAPTTFNLKKWLQENQTFEVVQPGTFLAHGMDKKQKQQPTQPSPVITSSVGKHIAQSPHVIQNMQVASSPNSLGVSIIPHSQKELDSVLPDQKPIKLFIEQIAKTTPNSPRPGTPKQLQKYPQQVSIKPDKVRIDLKEDTRERKERSSKLRPVVDNVVKKHSENVTPVSTNSEPIRLNVRRTLKEQLIQRINELGVECENGNKTGENLPKLSIEEIDKFVLETEAEMYEYFSRDTGSRYRAKYRSLMFNIKDRKNRTLFAKICTKIIQPKQLVRMSPEELASQELAQWRENEAKHQLEMIKKSELDLLSCAKNYVLKTHKGEEVIEGKIEDCVNLDVTIPVEDVVSVLNSSVVSSSSATEESTKAGMRSTPLSFDYQQNDGNRLEEENKKICLKEKERERDCERGRNREHGRDREHSHNHTRSPDSDHSREKQRKNKDRHRDKSKSRKRSRSHSQSRSRSREKRQKSHHKEEKRSKEDRDHDRDKFKEKDHDRDTRSENQEFDSRPLEKDISANSPLNVNSNKNSTSSIKDKNKLKKVTTSKPMETYSLIDQILESTKTVEEAANLISEREKLEEKEKERQKKEPSGQTITLPLPTSSETQFISHHSHSISFGNTSDDQEPTSTVATPPQDPYIRYSDVDSPTLSGNVSSACIWNGNINMVDVASFQILIQSVVGNSLNIGALLPDELDVVGRIGPDTVWEYISKIKRSPNKEIVIIRLIPASESETTAYKVLFQYLENRNRLGVINTVSPQIKDFYIYPLGAGKTMPPVLQPTEQVDFYEDPYRPDILMGVVVRIIGKRHSGVCAISASSSASKSYRREKETASFTPPGSPKRKRRIHASTPKVDEIDVDAIIKAPIVTRAQKTIKLTTVTDDADEPYSPGGSSDDDTPLTSKMTARSDEDELKRKMEELNRQIAAQEKEIAGLLNVESSCFATSSSAKTSAVLANISIPSNLSQILASIKSKPEGGLMQLSATSLQPQTTVINTATKAFSNMGQDEEYNPELVTFEKSAKPPGKASSRLAQLSEAELLSMVPDGMIDIPPVPQPQPSCREIKKHFDEPPPPGV